MVVNTALTVFLNIESGDKYDHRYKDWLATVLIIFPDEMEIKEITKKYVNTIIIIIFTALGPICKRLSTMFAWTKSDSLMKKDAYLVLKIA